MRKDYFIIGIIIFIAAAGVITISFVNGQVFSFMQQIRSPVVETASVSVEKGASGMAISLLETGTYNYNGPGFLGGGQRGPIHPLLVALTFLVFGEYIGSFYIVNFLLLSLAIILLWGVSRYYLERYWAFFPPVMLAVFPSALRYVASYNYEIFTLFLVLSSVFSFLKYRDTRNLWWLFWGSAAFAVLALERPMIFYAFPAILVLLVFWQIPYPARGSKKIFHAFVFIGVLVIAILPWSFRNYKVLGTWQWGSGGNIFLVRSTQLDFSGRELFSLALSYAVGDVIGSRIYAHYPKDTSPRAWDPQALARWTKEGWIVEDSDGEILNKVELDKKLRTEASARIRQKPLKFVLTSPINFLRLNAPVNYQGGEIMRLFVGNKNLPTAIKITVIFAIRFLWLLFLLLAFYALFRHSRDWYTWGILLFFVLYYNGMHSVFTHAEARYLFTILPFYFLFFTEGIRLLIFKKANKFPNAFPK